MKEYLTKPLKGNKICDECKDRSNFRDKPQIIRLAVDCHRSDANRKIRCVMNKYE